MILFQVLYYVVFLYFVVLILRLVLDWIQVFARDWRPTGIVLVLASGVYAATDPPINALRRILPPLRIGSVSLDLAFVVVFLVVTILMRVFGSLAS